MKIFENTRRKLHPLPILSNLQGFLDATAGAADHRPGLLALDVSKKAIGVAGADAAWRMATPLTTIRRTRLTADIERLRSLLVERDAEALVIGLPLNMDGSEGPRCQAIRQFAKDVDAAIGSPILLWDERLTTFEAGERADVLGLKGKKRTDMLDAFAASLILEDVIQAMTRPRA